MIENNAWLKKTLLLVSILMLSACSSISPTPGGKANINTADSAGRILSDTPSPYACIYTPNKTGNGQFYLDDGPGDNLPSWVDYVAEPQPHIEPQRPAANKPYTVLGQSFTPLANANGLKQQGIGSWYGRKFHGQKTASGEIYDMYSLSAASPILPIPSYARVTNLKNGRSIIVRVNDRGPFKTGRVMDLSFLAACRLGYAMNGSTDLQVESISSNDSPTPTTSPTHQESATDNINSENHSTTPPVVPIHIAAAGIYLQLGAFSAASNAESFRNHWAHELNADTNKLDIQFDQQRQLYRVRLGPYPDRNSAISVAEQLTGTHQLKAIISP